MKEQSLSLEDLERLGELLAGVPEPRTPMEPDMLDGFLTAICLMERPPRTEEWMPFVTDSEGRPGTGLKAAEERELRSLVLARGAQLERDVLSEKEIDPVLFAETEEDEESLAALTPFADGFSCACSLWPELLQSRSRAVQAALVGVLRWATPEEGEEEKSLAEGLDEDVAFANLDEGLADLQACVQEIAEVTRAHDIRRASGRRRPQG